MSKSVLYHNMLGLNLVPAGPEELPVQSLCGGGPEDPHGDGSHLYRHSKIKLQRRKGAVKMRFSRISRADRYLSSLCICLFHRCRGLSMCPTNTSSASGHISAQRPILTWCASRTRRATTRRRPAACPGRPAQVSYAGCWSFCISRMQAVLKASSICRHSDWSQFCGVQRSPESLLWLHCQVQHC